MSVNRIDQTPLRISNNVSITRQTPKTDFGDRMKQGINAGAEPPIVVTLLDLERVVGEVQQYYSLYRDPSYASVLAELASLRSHVKMVVSRARAATSTVPAATSPGFNRP
jgi:hypothetical protein